MAELTAAELDNVMDELVLKDAIICSLLTNHITALQSRIKTLESGKAVRELVDALRKYGQHKLSCHFAIDAREARRVDDPCECGYLAILAKYQPAHGQTEGQ